MKKVWGMDVKTGVEQCVRKAIVFWYFVPSGFCDRCILSSPHTDPYPWVIGVWASVYSTYRLFYALPLALLNSVLPGLLNRFWLILWRLVELFRVDYRACCMICYDFGPSLHHSVGWSCGYWLLSILGEMRGITKQRGWWDISLVKALGLQSWESGFKSRSR